jgi:hypothetical protein
MSTSIVFIAAHWRWIVALLLLALLLWFASTAPVGGNRR